MRARAWLVACLAIVVAPFRVPAVSPHPSQDAAADPVALMAAGSYERAEWTARARVDRLKAAEGDESLNVLAASDLLVHALLLNGRGADAETHALAVRIHQTQLARLGSAHPGLVPSLLNLGDTLLDDAEYQRAVELMERAVAICEGSPALAGAELADALDRLGRALTEAGRYDRALQVFERSLRLRETSPGPGSAGLASTLEGIGFAHQNKGSYERAGSAIRRALEIRRRINSSHPAYVDTLNLVAQQAWFEGNLLESKRVSEQAVALAGQTLRPDHPSMARSLRYLAGTVTDLGDLNQAFALKERALAIAERSFGPNHHETGIYLMTLAIAELERGAYPVARARFDRAARVLEARFGPWHDAVATAVANLAQVDARLGDFPGARAEQARAMAIWTRVFGPDHPFVAVALTELAAVYREQGLPLEALPLLQRALSIREKSLGTNHRDVAGTLADLAATLMRTGQFLRAQTAATRAVRIWERLDAPDAPEFATVLALYAELQANRGDYRTARDYYERALAIRARVFGSSHPLYAEAESGLGVALAKLGNPIAALGNAVSAETTGRDHLRLMLRSLPERQALNYAAARPRGMNLILSLAAANADAIQVAFNASIRSRALVLDEIAARRSAESVAAERADSVRTALTSTQQRLANFMVRGPGQLSAAQFAALVQSTRRESELAEQALAERSVEFRAQRSRAQIGLDEVSTALPPDSALVSFVRYDRLVSGTTGAQPQASAGSATSRAVPSYLAFVLRAEQEPVVVPLGPARIIDAIVSEWRSQIVAEALASHTTPDGPPVSSRESGAVLRRLVWDPITAHVAAARRVFIVPDGSLSLVPFAAFPTGRRGYLLESGPVIHYLSAERDLVPSSHASTTGGLLAIGQPSFDDPTLFHGAGKRAPAPVAARRPATIRGSAQPCGGVESIAFGPLDGTLQEVRELAGVWRDSSEPASGAAHVLTGRAASETTFKQDAHRYRVLHLATHGFFLSDDCVAAPAGTRGVGSLARTPLTTVNNPLLLSGLALAGANRRGSAGADEDDGILTAEEVAALNLENVDWAVLSACDTGLGAIKAGEGVFGLRRAFQVAGARTVIMSLWSVSDQATRAWMRALYEGRFQQRLTTADAVQAAGLQVLRDRRTRGLSTLPFYWAAFVAAGDWR